MTKTNAAPVKREGNSQFMKIAMVASVILLVVSLISYLTAALLPAVWISVLVVAALLMLCARMAWEQKWVRIAIRSLLLILVIGIAVFSLVSIIITEIAISQMGEAIEFRFFFEPVVQFVCLFPQFIFVAIMPVVIVMAYNGYSFDIMLMRVLAVVELIAGIFTAFALMWGSQHNSLVFHFYHEWLSVLYGLITALMTAACFTIFPPVWRPKWYASFVEKMEKKRLEREAKETAAEEEKAEKSSSEEIPE